MIQEPRHFNLSWLYINRIIVMLIIKSRIKI